MGEAAGKGVLITAETEAKYQGYISQQERQIERLREAEGRSIPDEFIYDSIPGLSNEVKQKLAIHEKGERNISDARTMTYLILSTGSGPEGRSFKSTRPDQLFCNQQFKGTSSGWLRSMVKIYSPQPLIAPVLI